MPYYFERINFAGEWMPQLSYDLPEDTSSEGSKRKMRNVVEITKEEYETASINELRSKYTILDLTKNPFFIAFKYRNYKGIVSIRRVVVSEVELTSVPDYYGPEEHLFLHGYDIDKEANRSFLLSECDFTTTTLET